MVSESAAELWNRGQALQRDGKIVDAGQVYADLVLRADCPKKIRGYAFSNFGIVMEHLGHHDKAVRCFELALQIYPQAPQILNNYGNTRLAAGEHAEAQAFFREALKRDASNPDARFNSSSLTLLFGDFEQGWRDYLYRWKCKTFSTPAFATKKPLWRGQRLEGKTILLTHEQGFGDSIMFCRYAKTVKARGAKCVRYVVPPELVCVLKGVAGVDEITTVVDEPHDFDFHCPLLNLPHVFKTRLQTIPAEVPYLTAESTDLTEKSGLKVGVVWAGRPEHGRDKWRSMSVEDFAPLFAVAGVAFHSLQFGARGDGTERYPMVRDMRPQMKDFADTARILNGLDLLISVDTAVVHLAGAMGRPVWVCLPFSPDWRWMLETDKSPWYPTMKLFRQEKKGEWGPVVERVKRELEQKASNES